MRGTPDLQMSFVSVNPEEVVPKNHPIRQVRAVVDSVLEALEPDFEKLYSKVGRPSVPPEVLLKSTILMAVYSVRSERQFCEQLNYNLLFKWFLGLGVDAPAFDATTFSKNRERLIRHDVAKRFLAAVVDHAKLRGYVSNEHFSVDGTLLEAWASHKSFKPINISDIDKKPPTTPGRNAEVNFHGEKRTNETHRSTTDPEARMARKSNAMGAKLSFTGHALMENRNALLVDLELTEATGFAERETALAMLERLPKTKRRRTLGADAAYDTRDFVNRCREIRVTPHVAQNTTNRRSRIDGRTTRHEGHVVSQRIRKRIEEPFGWIKVIAGGRKLRYRGVQRNRAWFLMAGAIYDVMRIAALDAQPG